MRFIFLSVSADFRPIAQPLAFAVALGWSHRKSLSKHAITLALLTSYCVRTAWPSNASPGTRKTKPQADDSGARRRSRLSTSCR